MTSKYARKRVEFKAFAPVEGLQQAVTLFEHRKFIQAFDLFEQLLEMYPEADAEILSLCYDCYQGMKDSSRYELYQRRHFNFPIEEGDRVLDVGSGNVPFPLATDLADFAIEDNDYGRAGEAFCYLEGRKVYQCAVEDMPFEDNEFDFVYCSHVLEHSTDPAKACDELMRVARKGYVETPSPAKDMFLNTAEVSNHLWAVEYMRNTLVFTEYDPDQKKGLKSGILMAMHTQPESMREKAFAALVLLRSTIMNTMFIWEDSFKYEVHWNRNWAGADIK